MLEREGQILKNWFLEIHYHILSFPGVSVVNDPTASAGDTKDMSLIPGSERYPGEGIGNPLQYSCLGSPIDRGSWQAAGHGATKNQT